jgi:hypothetical protein
MSFTTVLIGLLMIIAGVLALKFNYQLSNSFGGLGSLTRYIGSGNQYGVFKLLSIVVIFVGFLIMFGLADNFLNVILSPFKSLLNSGE